MFLSQRRPLLLTVLLVSASAIASGAVITLDDAGTDPPLLTPYLSFMTDQIGNFQGQFTNESNPPVDFSFLQLTAAFSPTFYNGPMGPHQVITGCQGGTVFNSCSVTYQDSIFTVVFYFFNDPNLNPVYPGLLAGHIVGVNAIGFQPNTLVGAVAPEPAGFALAGAFFLLLMIGVGRKKLQKSNVPVSADGL